MKTEDGGDDGAVAAPSFPFNPKDALRRVVDDEGLYSPEPAPSLLPEQEDYQKAVFAATPPHEPDGYNENIFAATPPLSPVPSAAAEDSPPVPTLDKDHATPEAIPAEAAHEGGGIAPIENLCGDITPRAVMAMESSDVEVQVADGGGDLDMALSFETALGDAVEEFAREADRGDVVAVAGDPPAEPNCDPSDSDADYPKDKVKQLLPTCLACIRERWHNQENAFTGLSDLQIAVQLKYGFEHIKTITTVDTIVSVRTVGVEDLFRPLNDALRPKACVTDALL